MCPLAGNINYPYLQSVLSNPSINQRYELPLYPWGVAYYLWKTKHILGHQPHESAPLCNMQNDFTKNVFHFFGCSAPGSPIILNMKKMFLGQQPVLIMEALWSCWEMRRDIFSWSYVLRKEDGTHPHPQLILCWKRSFFFLSSMKDLHQGLNTN